MRKDQYEIGIDLITTTSPMETANLTAATSATAGSSCTPHTRKLVLDDGLDEALTSSKLDKLLSATACITTTPEMTSGDDETGCWWCGKKVDHEELTCRVCSTAKFCSTKHLNFHCQQNPCPPFKVVYRGGKGRCVIATRDIEPLELIMSDTPIVIGPSRQRKLVCIECLKEVDGSVRCQDCQFPLCRLECAKEKQESNTNSCSSWHLTYECPYLKSIGFKASTNDDLNSQDEIPSFLIEMASIIALRLIFRGIKGVECSRDFIAKPLYDFYSTVKSSSEESCDQKSQENAVMVTKRNTIFDAAMTETLWTGMKLSNLLESKVTVTTVISQLYNNAKSLEKAGNDSSGLYARYALLNHACVSNVKVGVGKDDFKMEVRAQSAIKVGDEITTRYIGVNTGAPVRADIIRQHWSFTCSCLRCCDPTDLGTYSSALLCLHCKSFDPNDVGDPKGLILPSIADHSNDCGGGNSSSTPAAFSKEWRCNSCKKVLTKDAVSRTIDAGLRCIKNNTIIPPDINLLEQVIKDLMTIYHPKHYLIIQVKFVLMRVLSQEVAKRKPSASGGKQQQQLKATAAATATASDDSSNSSCKEDLEDVEKELLLVEKQRRLVSLCNEILEVLNVLDPGASPNRGRVLKEMIGPIMNISKFELKTSRIEESEFKLRKIMCSKLAKDMIQCYK